MLDLVDQAFEEIQDLHNSDCLYPVEMASPFYLIPYKVQIPEHPKSLGYIRDAHPQETCQFVRCPLAIPQKGKNLISRWVPEGTTYS